MPRALAPRFPDSGASRPFRKSGRPGDRELGTRSIKRSDGSSFRSLCELALIWRRLSWNLESTSHLEQIWVSIVGGEKCDEAIRLLHAKNGEEMLRELMLNSRFHLSAHARPEWRCTRLRDVPLCALPVGPRAGPSVRAGSQVCAALLPPERDP